MLELITSDELLLNKIFKVPFISSREKKNIKLDNIVLINIEIKVIFKDQKARNLKNLKHTININDYFLKTNIKRNFRYFSNNMFVKPIKKIILNIKKIKNIIPKFFAKIFANWKNKDAKVITPSAPPYKKDNINHWPTPSAPSLEKISSNDYFLPSYAESQKHCNTRPPSYAESQENYNALPIDPPSYAESEKSYSAFNQQLINNEAVNLPPLNHYFNPQKNLVVS